MKIDPADFLDAYFKLGGTLETLSAGLNTISLEVRDILYQLEMRRQFNNIYFGGKSSSQLRIKVSSIEKESSR